MSIFISPIDGVRLIHLKHRSTNPKSSNWQINGHFNESNRSCHVNGHPHILALVSLIELVVKLNIKKDMNLINS